MADMDGIEAAGKIKERAGNNAPVMVLTSYDFEDVEEQAREAGISAFLHKPFFVSNLRRAVEESLVSVNYRDRSDSPDEGGEFTGMHVLAAEDNEPNAEILTELLKTEGIECDIAVDGKAAVDLFNASEPGYYDMIFMDIDMPVMDGYEAAKAIRRSSSPHALSIPIIAMTANYRLYRDSRHLCYDCSPQPGRFDNRGNVCSSDSADGWNSGICRRFLGSCPYKHRRHSFPCRCTAGMDHSGGRLSLLRRTARWLYEGFQPGKPPRLTGLFTFSD